MFWNTGATNAEKKLDYLADAQWDIACLQEVSLAASAALAQRDGWMVVNGLDFAPEQVTDSKHPHGATLVARNGWQLENGAAVSGTPDPGRGVTAVAARNGFALSLLSWHAPFAAGGHIAKKMTGYRAALAAIGRMEEPLIVGLDSNHWSPGTELELPEPPLADDPYEVEQTFFSRKPQHRLRDAFIDYLQTNRDAYEEVIRLRPDGPLAVTYVHGGVDDRFDYIMISNQITAAMVTHDYDGARQARSDHALVCADLIVAAH
jgi:hypothetical protein